MQVRVNWAFQKDQREDTSQHCHIFVGDLSNEINDRALFEAFEHCGNCSDARVMWDHATGRCETAAMHISMQQLFECLLARLSAHHDSRQQLAKV